MNQKFDQQMANKERDHAESMEKLNQKHDQEINNHLQQERQLESTIIERDDTIRKLEEKLRDTQSQLDTVKGQI